MAKPTNKSPFQLDSEHTTGIPILDALFEHPMIILGIVIILIAGAAIYAGVRSHKSSKEKAANSALYHAQKTLDTETQAYAKSVAPKPTPAPQAKGPKAKKQTPPPQPQVNPEDIEFKKIDVDKQFPDAIQKFKKVVTQYPGTRAAFEADMTVGSLYTHHGEPAKAISWLQQGVSWAPRPYDRSLALSSLGYAYEGAGKYANAVQAFQKGLQSVGQGQDNMKGDFMISIARNEELMGDKAKAVQTYDQIIKEMPNSEQAHSAQILKAQIQ